LKEGLEISGSASGKAMTKRSSWKEERNLNTGGNNNDEAEGVVGHNKVHHSAAYPSQIRVSVVKR